MRYVIEHRESRLYPWCRLEYQHISRQVGKKNLLFTHLKTAYQRNTLAPWGAGERKSVTELDLSRACILDPLAKKVLTPEDALSFDTFIFGGILGDHPPQARTRNELSIRMPSLPTRHIGKHQMPTDSAVYVVQQIVEKHRRLQDLKFQDGVEFKIGKGESMYFPFRYVVVEGKPFFSRELELYVRKKKGF